MQLKKFEPPTFDNIINRHIAGGVESLTDEDVSTLIGLVKAYAWKLTTLGEVVLGHVVMTQEDINKLILEMSEEAYRHL